MSLSLLLGAVQEGFVYALVALGLFISYRILNLADMTTDGSFVLGLAISGLFASQGHPYLGLLLAISAGALAGLVTAFLQTTLGVPSILAGIITMTGLYSINLLIMGGPSLFFQDTSTLFTVSQRLLGKEFGNIPPPLIICLLVGGALLFFFRTRLGLSIRATGDNPKMVQASSINPRVTISVGLALSNALTALAGALLAQMYKLADNTLGTGVVVLGLASLIFGGIFFRRATIFSGVCAAIVGAVGYRILLTIALRNTSNPAMLKLISAVLVAVVIAYPTLKNNLISYRKRRKESRKYADPN